MEKHAILKQRKELKKNSHRIVRSHYMVLFFLTLVLVLFGVDQIHSSFHPNMAKGAVEQHDETEAPGGGGQIGSGSGTEASAA